MSMEEDFEIRRQGDHGSTLLLRQRQAACLCFLLLLCVSLYFSVHDLLSPWQTSSQLERSSGQPVAQPAQCHCVHTMPITLSMTPSLAFQASYPLRLLPATTEAAMLELL